MIGVASEFLDEGSTIFLEKERDQEARPIQTVGRTGAWLDLALVVLIDDDSASGAEVLAAGLRDNGRAQLVGETTFGTGTVLTTFPQDDGSSVVLATAFWLTPEGDHVWQEGVEPDQFVTLPRDAFPSRPEDDPEMTESELEGSADAQLRAALRSAGRRVALAVVNSAGVRRVASDIVVLLPSPGSPDAINLQQWLKPARGGTPLMLSSEGLPRPVVQPATITRRFQKFLLVGAIGLGVNQGVLFALVDQVVWPWPWRRRSRFSCR